MTRPYVNNTNDNFKEVIALSVPLALLVTGVSLVGIYSPNFYANETFNWQVQALGQDIIDLVLIVPVLVATAMITLKNKKTGILLWGGVVLYLVYTFVIYSFDVHFNKLFIAYCLALGISFYAFLYFIYTQLKESSIITLSSATVRKAIGVYLITISILFYFLWLSDIIPAIVSGTTPKILLDVGLPTNPVHVIDLAIFLPGIFITGILLLRNKKLGLILTPVMLVFFILMDITIGSLSVMMQQKGLEGSFILIFVMGVLALFSLVLLTWYIRKNRQ